MATQTQTSTGPVQGRVIEEKIRQLRELFADAPELGKKALENALQVLKSQAWDPPPVESAGCVEALARRFLPPGQSGPSDPRYLSLGLRSLFHDTTPALTGDVDRDQSRKALSARQHW